MKLNVDWRVIDKFGRHKGVRWFWRIGGGVFVVFFMAFGSLQTAVALAHEEETIHEEFDATDLNTLVIGNGAGPIDVVGGDGDTIEVTAEVSHGLRKTDYDLQVEGQRLVLTADCPEFLSDFCNVDYQVTVPSRLNVELRSSDSRIEVSGIDGNVDVEAHAGGIDASGLGGTARLRSSAGGINGADLSSNSVDASSSAGGVSLDFVQEPKSVVVKSSAGGVDVVVPDGSGPYVVTADSSAGEVETAVATEPPGTNPTAPTINAHSTAGGVTIRYR